MNKKTTVKVKRIDILEADLPFNKIFKHALSKRRTSNSIFIKIHLENGIVGYGEALPRDYVTHETTASVFKKLRGFLPKKVLGADFSGLKKTVAFINKLDELNGAAKCCIEIALLDALGKHFNKPISAVIGKPVKRSIVYSGVISADSLPSLIKNTEKIKNFGFKAVKVKVGLDNDLHRLEIVRNILGKEIDIRVDANCAWSTTEAIKRIRQMRQLGISAVEQPVKPYNIKGLKKITDSVPEIIIADESLTTIKDAQRLAKIKGCDMFNIRLSKCGGIFNALKIIDIARRHGIECQLGCQVGESGLLSAAGRHFASCFDNIKYHEGSYGKFLLKEDVTKQDMTFSQGGKAKIIRGPGLGVNVLDNVLNKYTTNRLSIE